MAKRNKDHTAHAQHAETTERIETSEANASDATEPNNEIETAGEGFEDSLDASVELVEEQTAAPKRGTREAADAHLAQMPDVPNGRHGAKLLDRALTSGASG
jgi:hypothetical protein